MIGYPGACKPKRLPPNVGLYCWRIHAKDFVIQFQADYRWHDDEPDKHINNNEIDVKTLETWLLWHCLKIAARLQRAHPYRNALASLLQ